MVVEIDASHKTSSISLLIMPMGKKSKGVAIANSLLEPSAFLWRVKQDSYPDSLYSPR